jgi:UDP-GlcNAc:undecaprenyl-phosphate GlcNAc-1-phosphate transferase
VLLLTNVNNDTPLLAGPKAVFPLLAVSLIFFVGLVDDIRGLRAKIKLLAQIAAALIMCSVDIRINSVTITDSLIVHFGWLSWPITVFWIVGLTNAVNLIDGLDGLAAGICAAACGVITILTLLFGMPVMTIIMLSLLGALTGFLFFNFNPAKVFMGDSGSLFLGFTIASSSILCASKTETIVGLALPVLALGIPVFDTFFSMLQRFLERRSILSPDQSHFHHRLLALGLQQRHVVIIAYGLTLFAAGLGMFMLVTRDVQTIVVFVCILLLLIIVFRSVGSAGLIETIVNIRQKSATSNQKKHEKEIFEKAVLYFHQARKFDEWWQAVCHAADKMDFCSSLLPLTNRDGTKRMLCWEKTNNNVNAEEIVKMTVPIHDRRASSALNLEVRVHANGSLESATRRLSLFSRLLEEYSVANLNTKVN